MNDEEKNNKITNKKLFYYGLIALIISTAVFISYFILNDIQNIVGFIVSIIRKILFALTPLIIAIILAYLFNKPIMMLEKPMKKLKSRRSLSIAIFYILIIGIITAIINFIFPKIQQSLIQLIDDLPNYTNIVNNNIQQSLEWLKSKDIAINSDNIKIENYFSKFSDISSIVLNGIMVFAKGLTQGVLNFVLAMILSFYILLNKEKLVFSIKELILLYGGKSYSRIIFNEVKGIDNILRGYISGMLLDTISVFILASIGLKIVGHNYFLLIGVALGILNLIPYFGSIIGCAVAFLLALFQGLPIALYTVITLILVEQFDANVIRPKILGDKVGLEPLWIITAVLVFGSLGGIFGMIIAVPFAALLKAIMQRIVEKKRNDNKKSTDNI